MQSQKKALMVTKSVSETKPTRQESETIKQDMTIQPKIDSQLEIKPTQIEMVEQKDSNIEMKCIDIDTNEKIIINDIEVNRYVSNFVHADERKDSVERKRKKLCEQKEKRLREISEMKDKTNEEKQKLSTDVEKKFASQKSRISNRMVTIYYIYDRRDQRLQYGAAVYRENPNEKGVPYNRKEHNKTAMFRCQHLPIFVENFDDTKDTFETRIRNLLFRNCAYDKEKKTQVRKQKIWKSKIRDERNQQREEKARIREERNKLRNAKKIALNNAAMLSVC